MTITSMGDVMSQWTSIREDLKLTAFGQNTSLWNE